MPKSARRAVPIDSGGRRERVLAARDALVTEHMHLVPPIAARVKMRLPDCFDVEDLEGAGYFGLIRAATRYRPRKHGGTPFSAFARIRIHGAMLDSVRRKHWDEATVLSLDAMDESFGRRVEPSFTPTVDADIDEQRQRKTLAVAIARLSDDQREIVEGFCQEQTAATIGAALGLAEWRVEREQAAAIAELRRRLAR